MPSELDLVLQRSVPVTCQQVWRAWTEPAQLQKWFCPDPYQTPECRIDLRPGGEFFTVIAGPGQDGKPGDRFENKGCYLDVLPERRLVWTTALHAGYRPAPALEFPPNFTCILELEPVPEGCRYTATAIHATAQAAQKHAEMGFSQGWGVALDQLVAMVQGRR